MPKYIHVCTCTSYNNNSQVHVCLYIQVCAHVRKVTRTSLVLHRYPGVEVSGCTFSLSLLRESRDELDDFPETTSLYGLSSKVCSICFILDFFSDYKVIFFYTVSLI